MGVCGGEEKCSGRSKLRPYMNQSGDGERECRFRPTPDCLLPTPHSWLTAASAASDDAALSHGAGVERAARLVFAEVAQFDHDLEDRPVLGHGALRNLGALLVADDWVERGDEDRVLAEPALGLLAVGGHADDALVG